MAFPQQREVHFPGYSPYAADALRGATGFPPPQQTQSPPLPYPRPLPGQPHDHAGVPLDAALASVNATGSRLSNEDRENIPPAVDNLAAQAQPQDLRPEYVGMGYYGVANDHPPPQGHRDHIIGDDAHVVQAVPPQAQAPVIDVVDDQVQRAAIGPARTFDEVPRQGPDPNGRASEVLRQLALLYLNDPNSKIVMIRMGPGNADEVTVDFTLKLTNL